MNFKKLFNWEYWPSSMFYIPNVPYAFLLALKAKNFTFFSAVNPAIKHSGNGTESKFETLALFPSEFIPKSIFVEKGKPIDNIFLEISKKDIQYPLIIKPDIGFRGLLVQQIRNEKELETYLKKNHFINLIIQEFIAFKDECGIFYHKLPGNKTGKITSITLKKYLTIFGDGTSSLKELILNDTRAIHYKDLLFEINKEKLQTILKKDEKKVLNVIGNHSKGTQFINGNHLITKELEQTFDILFSKIPNVFYGRVDCKYNSFEKLIDKNEFKIIEMNGIISEPTHIYDSNSITYFEALKEFRKHWKILYEITVINNKKYGVKYEKPSIFINSLLQLKRYTKQLKKNS